MSMFIASLLPLQWFLVTPLQLYLANLEEMKVDLESLVMLWLLPALTVFLVLFLLQRILKGIALDLFRLLIVGIVILSWFQGNVLLWDYGVLDGQAIDWGSYRRNALIDTAVWMGGLTIVLVFGRRWLPILWKAAAFLVFIQAGSIAVKLPALAENRIDTSAYVNEEDLFNLYRFSPDRNVIHLVVDGFQSDVFDYLVNHPLLADTYQEAFDGFTYYRETLGVYPYTRFSVPAFLSGNFYYNQRVKNEYIAAALEGKTLFSEARESGYEVDIGSGANYWVRQYAFTQPDNIYALDQDVAYNPAHSEASRLVDLSLFRNLPQIIKRRVYNNQNWWLSQWFSGSGGLQHWYFLHTRFLDTLGRNISVDREKPVYKYFHVMNTHNPMVVDQDCTYKNQSGMNRATLTYQSKCTIDSLGVLLQRLRDAGVYENSLIVIHGDHGGWTGNIRNHGPPIVVDQRLIIKNAVASLASPLLAIKPPGARGRMVFDDSLVSLAQLPDTISDILGFQEAFGQVPITDMAPDDQPLRRFYYYRWQRDAWESDHTGPLHEFEIHGSHYETEWRHVGTWLPGTGKRPPETR